MVVWNMSPVIKEVTRSEELTRARDAFYGAMVDDKEEEKRAANDAVGSYESVAVDTCHEYPGF